MSSDFKNAADLVNRFFENISTPEMKQAGDFMKSWSRAVILNEDDAMGSKIDSHSRVLDVNKGSIIVEVDHPGWSQQILLRKKHILGMLSKQFPDLGIRNISIRVKDEYIEPYKRSDETIGKDIPRSEPEQLVISEDTDEELKKALLSLKNTISGDKSRS
ncbi:DUF721 domain-containing protein [Brucepastera parasyntrophica]|uniref:DUF721 domain-containing protein n=1 Tax=Brucepastera parasyntrophica TaxID=2880008 RepID=UPI00210E3F02|nr:DUF721 domain-containing protein [Brucepastera parasyntrophica]ULQ58616.1 DUF721 domain-containing protein [Brucepastera parasyntrophica]